MKELSKTYVGVELCVYQTTSDYDLNLHHVWRINEESTGESQNPLNMSWRDGDICRDNEVRGSFFCPGSWEPGSPRQVLSAETRDTLHTRWACF